MRGPHGVTTAMRGCYIEGGGYRMKRAEAASARDESGWSAAEENCGKLKRGQIEINSRVTKPRLKY